MIWEDWRGQRARASAGASCRTSPRSSPTCCATTASSAATASRCCCPPRPRRRPPSSAPGSPARSCSRCRCSTATRASGTASRTRRRRCSSPNAENADRIDRDLVEHVILILDDELLADASTELRDRRHGGRRPGPALLLVRHDRARQGHPPRAPLPARARGVRLLPRRAGRRALPRHGRVGVGGGHRAAARPVAARRDAVRLPAPGRLRSRAAARGALEARRRRTSSRRRPRCAR